MISPTCNNFYFRWWRWWRLLIHALTQNYFVVSTSKTRTLRTRKLIYTTANNLGIFSLSFFTVFFLTFCFLFEQVKLNQLQLCAAACHSWRTNTRNLQKHKSFSRFLLFNVLFESAWFLLFFQGRRRGWQITKWEH